MTLYDCEKGWVGFCVFDDELVVDSPAAAACEAGGLALYDLELMVVQHMFCWINGELYIQTEFVHVAYRQLAVMVNCIFRPSVCAPTGNSVCRYDSGGV